MSFAQSLREQAMESRTRFREEIFSDFYFKCEERAFEGCFSCDKRVPKPEWWSGEDMKTLKQRVDELGFTHCFVCECSDKSKKKMILQLSAYWELDSQAPEKTGTGPSGTSSTCPICHEIRPVVALTPCGHVVCKQCQESQQFGRCPMCRTQVTGATQGLFMWSDWAMLGQNGASALWDGIDSNGPKWKA